MSDVVREMTINVNWTFARANLPEVLVAVEKMSFSPEEICVRPDQLPGRIELTFELTAGSLETGMRDGVSQALRAAAGVDLPADPLNIYVTDDVFYDDWRFVVDANSSRSSVPTRIGSIEQFATEPVVRDLIDQLLSGTLTRQAASDRALNLEINSTTREDLIEAITALVLSPVSQASSRDADAMLISDEAFRKIRTALA